MKKPNRKPRPEPEEVEEDDSKGPPPDLSDLPSLKPYAAKIENLTLRRQAIHDKLKTLTDQKDELTERLLKILKRTGVERVKVKGYPVWWGKGSRTFLDENLLIEKGVDPALIRKCKRTVPTKEYLKVGKKSASPGPAEE